MGLGPALILAAIVIVAVVLLTRPLIQLRGELARLARNQEDLRQDVQRGREASILQLSETAKGLHGEIGQAQKALAEVKALEQGRARQLEQAADSLKRLEAVVAGSATRGVAGENILARALAQLPPDLLEINVAFGSRIVEYALRLPGGRFLPIDSKWTSVALLERLDTVAEEQPQERKRLLDQVLRDLRTKIRDMTKYLDPERTLSLGLLAVPDAVYVAAPEAHGEGYREGILVVPYSLALPYVLALYRLTVRFGCAVDTDQLASRLRQLEEILRRSGDEVESRLSRGLVQVENARDALRDNLLEARRATERLLQTAADEPRSAALPAHLPVLMVGERD
jgi:DNA recombination protein RmuC